MFYIYYSPSTLLLSSLLPLLWRGAELGLAFQQADALLSEPRRIHTSLLVSDFL
jgi:hypothetical protein